MVTCRLLQVHVPGLGVGQGGGSGNNAEIWFSSPSVSYRMVWSTITFSPLLASRSAGGIFDASSSRMSAPAMPLPTWIEVEPCTWAWYQNVPGGWLAGTLIS